MSAYTKEFKKGLSLERGTETRSKEISIRAKKNRRQKLRQKRQVEPTLVKTESMTHYEFIAKIMQQINLQELYSETPERMVKLFYDIFTYEQGDVVLDMFHSDDISNGPYIFQDLSLIDRFVILFDQEVTPYNVEMMRQLGWICLLIGYHTRMDIFTRRLFQAGYMQVIEKHLKFTDDFNILDDILRTLSNAVCRDKESRSYILGNGMMVGINLFYNRLTKLPDSLFKSKLFLDIIGFTHSCFTYSWTEQELHYVESFFYITEGIQSTINPLEQMTPDESKIYGTCLILYREIAKSNLTRSLLSSKPNLSQFITNMIGSKFLNNTFKTGFIDIAEALSDDPKIALQFFGHGILRVMISVLESTADPNLLKRALTLLFAFAWTNVHVIQMVELNIMQSIQLIMRNVNIPKIQEFIFNLTNAIINTASKRVDEYQRNIIYNNMISNGLLRVLERALNNLEIKVVKSTLLSIELLFLWDSDTTREAIYNTEILQKFNELMFNKHFDSTIVNRIMEKYIDPVEEMIEMEVMDTGAFSF